jgi:MoxR-like ATPase
MARPTTAAPTVTTLNAVPAAPAFTPRFFDPASAVGAVTDADGCTTVDRPGRVYVYNPAIVLAVNAALATQRPLLIAGSPGTGKTTLAANVAAVLGRKFYQRVVTSRTRARDLLWRFDQLQRLAAAHEGRDLPPRAAHIEPQLLWWAFDPASAALRGALPGELDARHHLADPATGGPGPQSVVLLDEIDKAEPDVPNDLLEVLDLERFQVDDLEGQRVVQGRRGDVLVCITTNRERELPGAFVRRCVVLDLDRPEADWPDWLVRIGRQRLRIKGSKGAGARLLQDVAAQVMALRTLAEQQGQRKPGTAEFLDMLRACIQLGIQPGGDDWQRLSEALLGKGRASTAADGLR